MGMWRPGGLRPRRRGRSRRLRSLLLQRLGLRGLLARDRLGFRLASRLRRSRGGFRLDGSKLRDLRRRRRPELGDGQSAGRLRGGAPGRFAAQAAREAVLGLQDAAVLLGERVGKRGPGDEAALHDDLAQAPAGLRLLLESQRELLLVEEAGGDENPAELRCWKLSRVHDSSIGLDAGFVRPSAASDRGRVSGVESSSGAEVGLEFLARAHPLENRLADLETANDLRVLGPRMPEVLQAENGKPRLSVEAAQKLVLEGLDLRRDAGGEEREVELPSIQPQDEVVTAIVRLVVVFERTASDARTNG